MMGAARKLWVPLIALLMMLGSGAWLVTQDGHDGRECGPWKGTGKPMMRGPAEPGWLAGDRDSVDDPPRRKVHPRTSPKRWDRSCAWGR